MMMLRWLVGLTMATALAAVGCNTDATSSEEAESSDEANITSGSSNGAKLSAAFEGVVVTIDRDIDIPAGQKGTQVTRSYWTGTISHCGVIPNERSREARHITKGARYKVQLAREGGFTALRDNDPNDPFSGVHEVVVAKAVLLALRDVDADSGYADFQLYCSSPSDDPYPTPEEAREALEDFVAFE